MQAKKEIAKLVEALSEYECGHLLSAFQNVAAGERFWESEISLVYNEHVKMRMQQPEYEAAAPATEAGIFAPIPIVKSYSGAARVSLPKPDRLPAALDEVILQRRSRRDYSGGAMSASQLAALLHYSCGITGFTQGYGYKRLPLRAFPSSGGLQAPEVYVSVQAVADIPAGIYHYHVIDNQLERLRDGHHGATLRKLALDAEFLQTAAAVFLITGRFERLRWKYGQRAYKFMCMDAGYLGQNLYLVAEALQLGACAVAGFLDDGVEQLLDVDGRHEMVLLLTAVGVPNGAQSGSA